MFAVISKVLSVTTATECGIASCQLKSVNAAKYHTARRRADSSGVSVGVGVWGHLISKVVATKVRYNGTLGQCLAADVLKAAGDLVPAI